VGGELLSFDEALAELQMATHELRSLVAQGEVRAFRDEDVLKFRRTDILELKKSRDTSPGGLVIEPTDIGDEVPTLAELDQDAPAMPAKHETEETELLTGIGRDESTTDFLGLDDTAVDSDVGGDTAQTVVPTIEIADEDMIDDTAQTVIPMVSSEEETDEFATAQAPIAPSLLAEDDEATEMATQEIAPEDILPTAHAAPVQPTAESPLRFQDDAATVAAGDLDISTEDVEGATVGQTAPRRVSERYATPAEAVSPIFFILALLTFGVLLFAIPIFYHLAAGDQALDFAPYKELMEFLRQKTL
jgi:hypothetical protein